MANNTLRFAQGFNVDSTGWFDQADGQDGITTEVPSGTNGITAAEGAGFSIFEQTNGTGPFTRFDGYRSLNANQEFTASIKIYLDPGSLAPGEGFDYSVAANNQSGAHLRDFIFHVTMDTSTGDLLVGASNNTNFDPREDLETINHAQITTAGWYTFEHTFFDFGDGTLAVSMTVMNSAGVTLFTEVRNDPSDSFTADFGGNRYGWFTNIDVAGGIAVDDTRLLTADSNTVQVYDGSTIVGTFSSVQEARDAADAGSMTGSTFRVDVAGSTQFFYVANGMSIQAAIDAAAAGDTVEVADGAYNESLSITKAVTLAGQDIGADGVPDIVLTPTGANAISISGDIDNGGAASVSITGFAVSGAATAGVHISSSTDLSSLIIADSAFSNNAVFGIGTGSGAFNLDSVSITNTTFTDNGQGGANGAGDIVLFGFVGDATLQDVAIVSSATSGTPDPSRGDNAIQITGRDPVTYDVLGPIGAVHFNNVSVNGWYHKPQVLIQGYTDFNALTLTNVNLSGGTSWGDLLFVDPIGTSGTGAPATPGQPGHFPLTGGTSTLDLSDVTVNSGSTGVLGLDSRIRGTDADDLIVGTNGNDLLNDLAETSVDYGGDDTVIGGAGDDIIIGGSGADSLIGGSGADYMNGGSGVDTADYSASGAGVTVKIWAGTGVGGDAQGDTLVKIENLIGSAFNDRLIGLFNQDNLFLGGDGNDYFDGFAGVDTIYGGAGDDRIIGGADGDYLDGGDGYDIVSYGSSNSGINVNLKTLAVSGGDAAGDTLVAVEGVIGSAFADVIIGDDGYNTIQANGGADWVNGGAGYDFINGHNGADMLIGGTGNDTLIGGLHDDTFRFSPGDGADRINDFGVGGVTGNDQIELKGYGAAFDTFAEVMAAASQQGGDTLIDLGGGDSILLVGVSLNSLNSGDFIFS
ncbi:MAG: hypothetical protein KDD85_09905 [Parvularculaceae bacterium]|nr:hypothetical protein [Parvularculaceae bacterium]